MKQPGQPTQPDGRQRRWAAVFAVLLALWGALLGTTVTTPAKAVVIELMDVASDRVERQRAEAIGQLPLPGTPNVSQLTERLAEKTLTLGSPILIRVFKASSELEIWMQRGARFELFATYPICNWSGTLGPKLTEGDKQSPEGVYTVTSRQLHLIGRHPRSLNLGFPNALDRQMSRTGSYILIHGACSSVGCFAMTNPVIEEIYSLASAALNKGKQDAVQVHVFPFRMTEEHLKAYALNEWYDFWRNLKDVSDSFERTRLPPRVSICEGRYWVDDATAAEEVASHGPLAVCAVSQAEAASQSSVPVNVTQSQDLAPWWPLRAMLPPSLVPSRPSAPMLRHPRDPYQLAAAPSSALSSEQPSRPSPTSPAGWSNARATATTTATTNPLPGPLAGRNLPARIVTSLSTTPCSKTRASCRHWMATQQAAYAFKVAQSNAGRRGVRVASKR